MRDNYDLTTETFTVGTSDDAKIGLCGSKRFLLLILPKLG